MFIQSLPICYNQVHSLPTDAASNQQVLNPEDPISKIVIRAILRRIGVDVDLWSKYSLQRCHCKAQEGQDHDGRQIEGLGIAQDGSLFIQKLEKAGKKKAVASDLNDKTVSRKRKERDEIEVTPPTSSSSTWENLEPRAAATARSISKLLGGDAWKNQSVGKPGMVQTKHVNGLQALQRVIKMSLQIPQIASVEAGHFNSDLVEALARAYHQRVGSSSSTPNTGQKHFFNLGLSDYEKAHELLKGKIEGNGSCERSDNRRLDDSALSNPVSRFPLSDSGLSGSTLTATRAICVLWNNDKWLTQAPLPGLSPISLKRTTNNAIIGQIAQLTRVKPGEASPDGFPQIVLEALRDSIKKNKEAFDSDRRGRKGGWSQKRNLEDALALLKKQVAPTRATPPFVASPSSDASGSRVSEERHVRRRLDDGE